MIWFFGFFLLIIEHSWFLPLFLAHGQFPVPTDPKTTSRVRRREASEVRHTKPKTRVRGLLSVVFILPSLSSLRLFTSHSHSRTKFIFSLFIATRWWPEGALGMGASITCGSIFSSRTGSLDRWKDGFTITAPRMSLLGGARCAELGRCGICVSSNVHALCGIFVSSSVHVRWAGWIL